MKIPFISGEGPDGYLPVNLYLSPRKIYGRDALVGRHGLLEFSDTGNGDRIRASIVHDGAWWSVCGNKLYRTDVNGTSFHRGTFQSSIGDVWMESSGDQLGIVLNRTMYVFEGGSLSTVSTGFTPSSLAYLSGYFISHDLDTGHFYESNLFDITDWNELEYALTEVSPDDLKGLYNVNGEILAMGSKSGETYYNSGGSDFSFSKVPGGNIPTGIISAKSAAQFMGALIMLNQDRTVVQAGVSPVKLSNEHVDRSLAEMSTVDDATAFIYTDSGHTFYVLTLPTGNKTFALDLTTKFWYEWKTDNGRWRPNCYAEFNKKHLVGDYSNGKIYELSRTTYTDDGERIIRQRTMPVQKGPGFETFSSFEIEQEGGVGISTGQGSDPKAALKYSKDKGKTWSNEKWTDIGKAGEYKQRLVWRRLGTHRHFTVRVTVTDPVKTVWTGAHINDDS